MQVRLRAYKVEEGRIVSREEDFCFNSISGYGECRKNTGTCGYDTSRKAAFGFWMYEARRFVRVQRTRNETRVRHSSVDPPSAFVAPVYGDGVYQRWHTGNDI